MADDDDDDGGEGEVCCVCGKPAYELYDDRDDSPYCGAFRCGYLIQRACDYHDERGG